MKTKRNKGFIFGIVTVLILAFSLGYLGLIHRSLLKERDGLLVENAALAGKADMLKKSYSEQKAKADSAVRARQAAEVKAAKANQELAEREVVIKDLQGKIAALEGEMSKAKGSDQERQAQIQEAIAQWKAKVGELQEANAAGQAKIKEQGARIVELDGTVISTKAALENETRAHQDCRGKNVNLCGIAQDLANSYRNKGVIDAVRTSEPLTQLKKVELEKLIQEYLDRIDTESLPQTGALPQ